MQHIYVQSGEPQLRKSSLEKDLVVLGFKLMLTFQCTWDTNVKVVTSLTNRFERRGIHSCLTWDADDNHAKQPI